MDSTTRPGGFRAIIETLTVRSDPGRKMAQKRTWLSWRRGGADAPPATEHDAATTVLPAFLLRRRPPLLIGVVVAALAVAVETVLVVLLKQFDRNEAFETLYLLGILVISMTWGVGLAVIMSVVSAVALAYIRDWPTMHLAPFKLDDVVFLGVFLVVALMTNLLTGWARARTVETESSRDKLATLAEDQAALRRVATLVARGAAPSEVFGAVIDEIRRCVHAGQVGLWRFEGIGAITLVAAATEPALLAKWPVGTRTPVDGDNLASVVLRTGRPARMNSYDDAAGPIAARVREQGVREAVGVPIIVGGRVWGMAAVGSAGPDVMPADAEARIGDFAGLVATAIASAATREELQASRDSLGVLVTQQSALRRVATLVARGVAPEQVFSAVAEEMARCLNLNNAEIVHYDHDGAAVVVASYAEPKESVFPVGERFTIEGDNVASRVLQTGRAARIDDYTNAIGSTAMRVRQLGIRSAVGAPIVVDERPWGMALVRSSGPEPLPADTETHIAEFADLIATAVAAAITRAELIKSRGRIVAATDETRRRLERNLHDGAQQRAVSLALHLRLAADAVPPELRELKDQLSRIQSGLIGLTEELREISHGIHPAILSRGGLRPALKTLARRSMIPVTLDVGVQQRLPESVEVATYYVVAEAFTNAAKHAQAAEVTVSVNVDTENLHLLVRDDGVGGADSVKGTGLIGLKDRVESLGGQLEISSPAGSGTTLHATIPLHRP